MSEWRATAAQEAPRGREAGGRGRLLFVDDIRWLIIVLVVLVHLAVTYGRVGSWYYIEAREPDLVSGLVLVAFCSFSQAFFMGLLFFIAGYFVPGPYDRKGGGRFLADRLFRLGVPVLFYMLVLNPLTNLVRESFMGGAPANLLQGYGSYLASLDVLSGTGPLWFALALLIFSLAYALVRRLSGAPVPVGAAGAVPSAELPGTVFGAAAAVQGRGRVPAAEAAGRGAVGGARAVTHGQVAALFAVIAALTFLVRLVQPFGSSFFNMQLGNFPSYIVLFAVGTWAYRSRFLERVPERLGRAWLRIVLFAGIPLWVAIALGGGAMEDTAPLFGGWHWQAAAYAAWESLFTAGMGFGLIVLFRRRSEVRPAGERGRLSAFLSANAFGVYVFHPPLLVLIAMLLRGWEGFVLLKFAVAAVVALPACFLVSWAVRRVPLLRKVFA